MSSDLALSNNKIVVTHFFNMHDFDNFTFQNCRNEYQFWQFVKKKYISILAILDKLLKFILIFPILKFELTPTRNK
jgi:hypothetical protein